MQVRLADDVEGPVWVREDVAIKVPTGGTFGETLLQVRALLVWLGAAQPGPGATCWCGEPVTVPGLHVAPRQRQRLMVEEGAHGAA